jgi:hypothetical protein
MANQPNPSNFQDDLTVHNHLKWSTDLPLFHGHETKDTITGYCPIDRIEVTAEIPTWDFHSKVRELASIFQGPAQSWWDSLETFKIYKASWNFIKTSFLRLFEQKYSPKTVCASLQDLMLKLGEKNLERQFFTTLPGT